MHKDLHKNAGNGLKKALFLENFPRADSYLLPPPLQKKFQAVGIRLDLTFLHNITYNVDPEYPEKNFRRTGKLHHTTRIGFPFSA